MDLKVEFGHDVLGTVLCDKLLLDSLRLLISGASDFLLPLRVAIEEVKALSDDLANKVFAMNPLGVFVKDKGTPLEPSRPACDGERLVVLVELHPSLTSLVFMNNVLLRLERNGVPVFILLVFFGALAWSKLLVLDHDPHDGLLSSVELHF